MTNELSVHGPSLMTLPHELQAEFRWPGQQKYTMHYCTWLAQVPLHQFDHTFLNIRGQMEVVIPSIFQHLNTRSSALSDLDFTPTSGDSHACQLGVMLSGVVPYSQQSETSECICPDPMQFPNCSSTVFTIVEPHAVLATVVCKPVSYNSRDLELAQPMFSQNMDIQPA